MDIEEIKLKNEQCPAQVLDNSLAHRSNSFNFPFQPYDIQLKLMKVAYDTYENSKFALLESPTGTGKSMSLICSVLSWVRDHQRKTENRLESKREELTVRLEQLKIEEETSGDWLSAQTKRQDVNKELDDISNELETLNKFKIRSETRRRMRLHDTPLEHFLAAGGQEKRGRKDDRVESAILAESGLSNLQGLLNDNEEEDIEKLVEQDEDHVRPKIYYTSRTHSQLSQFISEIKRTVFASINEMPAIKLTPLASRAILCVNPEVVRLKEASAINERCVELQRETNKDKRCPYMKLKEVITLKEDILSSVQDIEDVVARGKRIGGCPYYAARMSIPEAEVVVLPYNNLLHQETRKASLLDLRDNIVIIDEAHNILETICSIHSAPITGLQLIGSHTILSRYYNKFQSRMSPKNAEMIKVIVKCLTALIKFLNEPRKLLLEFECSALESYENDSEKTAKASKQHCPDQESIIDITKFMGAAKIEQFNVFKIIDYFGRSQLARKLLGFYRQDDSIDLFIELSTPACNLGIKSVKREETTHQTGKKKPKLSNAQSQVVHEAPSVINTDQTNLGFLQASNLAFEAKLTSYPIYTLVEFLKSLTNLSHDGKVLVHHCEGNIQKSAIKFVLLNPSSQFKQMVQEARSIVLAGGTMQPFDEFIALLFGPLGIERDRLTLFSCGHVIGHNQLCIATLSTGITGKPIELSYKTRSSLELIDEIGLTILSLSNIVPGGMVCFLPSYEYEQLCFNRWSRTGTISKIETNSKQVFREPRQASQARPILDDYSRVIERGRDKGKGAILFCVVGGKMSEGINFNDDLGRCVVMIGLPFANVKSGELRERMSYYDQNCKMVAGQGVSAGQQYYENLCIKGINQSIGRAVRHKKDYAAIVLLDRRYSNRNSIRNGLPSWMLPSLTDYNHFKPMSEKLKVFFSAMRANQQQTKPMT